MTRHKNKNRYEEFDDFIIGYTNKNQEFYFNHIDYENIIQYTWTLSTTDGYLYAHDTKTQKQITMQKVIINKNIPKNFYIDHINRNRVDNRRTNLRIVTKQQNRINSGKQSNNTSGIIGVKKYGKNNKWRVQINKGLNERIHLDVFDNIYDATICRLQAELKYFGREFAPQRDLFSEYGI